MISRSPSPYWCSQCSTSLPDLSICAPPGTRKGHTLRLCLVSKALFQPMVALEGLDITMHHPDTFMEEGGKAKLLWWEKGVIFNTLKWPLKLTYHLPHLPKSSLVDYMAGRGCLLQTFPQNHCIQWYTLVSLTLQPYQGFLVCLTFNPSRVI